MSTYCEAVGRGPNTSPLGVEDGGSVKIPSSQQTKSQPVSVDDQRESFGEIMYLVSM